MNYKTKYEIIYYSKRYDKYVTVPKGYETDGATWAVDIHSESWKVHDKLCDTGLFDDGTECNNRQASQILSDILKAEGHWIRAQYWYTFTWLFGGGEARKNGMW